MKRPVSLFLALCCSALVFGQNPKKVVFIIADGISADALEKLNTPNINAIAAKGKYMRAHVGGEKGSYSETPTISAVGYNSLLTGTWVNKHNVPDNDIKEPNYNYPTIFRLFSEAYPKKKTAIYSSWTDNRTKLIGEGLAATGNIKLSGRFDGYELDTLRFPHDKQRNFMHQIDEQVSKDAATYTKGEAPDLSWVYLEYTDDMGHMYGDGVQYNEAILKLDVQVGRIWEAIQYREAKFKEDWLIVITTDHGRDESTGRGHGGQSARQRGTWIVTNYPHLNTYAKYYQPGIVDIMPTMAKFLSVTLPAETKKEIDGVSLIGDLSLVNPHVTLIQGNLDIVWKALADKGNVKVWVTTTNKFKSGGKDDYQLMAEIPLSKEHASINVNGMASPFYKIVLEGPLNTVNRWFVVEDKKK